MRPPSYPLRLSTGAALTFILLLTACATSGINPEIRSAIPPSATTVKLLSDLSPTDLYAHTYRFLRQKGFRFTEANESMLSLSTEGMSVGKSQTDLRIDILVEPDEPGSVLTATAEYMLLPGEWRPVAFKDSGTKYKVGFEELVLLIRQLPHKKIRYEVDQDRARRAFSI